MKMKFEKWMTETYDEPDWDEGWTRVDMEAAYFAGKESILGLLIMAKDHLEYCNYGDSWERECSKELREDLDDFFAK
jgi:hypothetical protein